VANQAGTSAITPGGGSRSRRGTQRGRGKKKSGTSDSSGLYESEEVSDSERYLTPTSPPVVLDEDVARAVKGVSLSNTADTVVVAEGAGTGKVEAARKAEEAVAFKKGGKLLRTPPAMVDVEAWVRTGNMRAGCSPPMPTSTSTPASNAEKRRRGQKDGDPLYYMGWYDSPSPTNEAKKPREGKGAENVGNADQWKSVLESPSPNTAAAASHSPEDPPNGERAGGTVEEEAEKSPTGPVEATTTGGGGLGGQEVRALTLAVEVLTKTVATHEASMKAMEASMIAMGASMRAMAEEIRLLKGSGPAPLGVTQKVLALKAPGGKAKPAARPRGATGSSGVRPMLQWPTSDGDTTEAEADREDPRRTSRTRLRTPGGSTTEGERAGAPKAPEGAWRLVAQRRQTPAQPRKAPAPAPTRRPRERCGAITVSTGRRSFAEVMQTIKAAVPAEQADQVQRVRKAPSGDLVVEMRRGATRTRVLMESIKLSLGDEASVRLKEDGTAIELKGVEVGATHASIAADVNRGMESTACSESCVKWIHEYGPYTRIALLVVPYALASRMLAQGWVRVGWSRCAVRTKKLPTLARCYRCLGYGHEARACAGANRRGWCLRCGGEGHQARECQGVPRCFLCAEIGAEDTAHESGRTGCAVYDRAVAAVAAAKAVATAGPK
jgi:hypothetical protein